MEVLSTSNKISLSIDVQPDKETTVYIKQENYEEDSDSQIDYNNADLTKVKQEDLDDCYTTMSDTLDNSLKVEDDIDIQDELENNLLTSRNMEGCTTATNDSEKVQKGRPSPSAGQISRLEVKHSKHWPAKCKLRRCRVCSSKKKCSRTVYYCKKCDVGLCVVDCFEKWHTREKF